MTGVFKKKRISSKDMIKFYHTATVPQLNILHEIASQHLQHPPSASWGYQRFPLTFSAEPSTWEYLRESTRHPVHEFARRMTANTDISKKAGSIGSAIVEGVSAAGRTLVKYGVQAGQAVIKHRDDIATGVRILKDTANLVSQVGMIAGLVSPETHEQVTGITSAISDTVDKHKSKPKAKKGGWIDAEHLLSNAY